MARKTDEEGAGDTPDLNDILNRLTIAVEILASRQAAGETVPGDMQDKLAAALVRLSESNMEAAKFQAAEQRRIHRPSNEVVPMVSALNLRGENCLPKPRLKCVMMIPWLVDQDSVTREEVELLNLLQPGDYVIRRTDNMRIKIECKIDFALDEITPSRLLLTNETAFNNDNQQWMPPLPLYLRMLLRQHKDPTVHKAAEAVLSMDEEEALLKAEGYVASVAV